VYYTPAPTKAGVFPLGGGVRYLISADGAKFFAKRQIHKSIIEAEPAKGDENEAVGGIHTHVLSDTPEDTDLFVVLTRKPSAPEIVVAETSVFEVDPDASIKYVGKSNEEVKKR
jgi:hypothetical protein